MTAFGLLAEFRRRQLAANSGHTAMSPIAVVRDFSPPDGGAPTRPRMKPPFGERLHSQLGFDHLELLLQLFFPHSKLCNLAVLLLHDLMQALDRGKRDALGID